MPHPLSLGFNTFDSHVLNGDAHFTVPLSCGADFVFCHTDPTPVAGVRGKEKAARLADVFGGLGVPFIANFEFQNVIKRHTDEDGHDWCVAPDGAHRLYPNPAFIEALASRGNLLGVCYDEFDYCVSTRNLSMWLTDKTVFGAPCFPPLKTKNALTQGDAIEETLKAYVKEIKAMGAPCFAGEHVFPILYHAFARAGMIPNFKAMKENPTNLQFAVAAGAALEYGTPLWSCVDLWHRQTFPGHSPEELYRNLLFCFLAGVDLAYVESDPVLVKDGALSPHGRAWAAFINDFRGKPRDHSAADYRPTVGILRYDDAWWGQNAFWYRGLFGNPALHPDARSKEWLRVINMLTFGQSGKQSFNLNRIDHTLLKKHRSFVPMNGLAVFDDRPGMKALSSLKLAFLCGLTVAPETMRSVRTLVRTNGLIAVCPPRFLPAELAFMKGKTYAEIPDGKGLWIISADPADERVFQKIRPLLGEENEITLPFTNRTVRLRIEKGGESFAG